MISVTSHLIEKYGAYNVSTLLVGTKCDLERKITKEKVIEISEEHSIPWIETR